MNTVSTDDDLQPFCVLIEKGYLLGLLVGHAAYHKNDDLIRPLWG